MRFRIEAGPELLRVEIRGRETPEETIAIVEAILGERERHDLRRVLIIVRESRTIFRVEQYRLSEIFARLVTMPGIKVALVSDSAELYASHEYIELLARQKGLAVQSFKNEESATAWLLAVTR
jgi:hypothetical protein